VEINIKRFPGGYEMKWIFDLDGTICDTKTTNSHWDYKNSEPKLDVIEKINELYDMGHYIVIYTARGSTSKIDYEDLTKRQLNMWNVHYHELKLGKPAAEIYVDDRTITPDYLTNNWNLVLGFIGKYG
jgi:dTDP-glucose 4,6-dehydratase